jgi:O-antigen/teichoic acid export membrane protein
MNIKKILGFSIGPVGAALLGAVSLPLSTWMFGVEDIGRISLLQTLTNLMIILLGLGLDQSYVREYHHTPERRVLFHLVIKPGLIFFSI